MLLLQGGRGDISVGKVGVNGARHMLFFCKIEDSQHEAGDHYSPETVSFDDILLGFSSDKSGSFRAVAEVATQIADAMDAEQSYQAEAIGELPPAAHAAVETEERLSTQAQARIVQAVRREMMELGYHYDDLTDEIMEDMLREFECDFDGDEDKFVEMCVASAADFVSIVAELHEEREKRILVLKGLIAELEAVE